MGNFRDKILAAQAVAVRYRQAKVAGLSGAEALNELALMIAAASGVPAGVGQNRFRSSLVVGRLLGV